MKKEFKDLTTDEKKEYYLLRAISLDLPYTISMIPFIVLMLISTSVYIGIGSTVIFIFLAIEWFLDLNRLNKVYEI